MIIGLNGTQNITITDTTFSVVQTVIGTTPTKIELPDGATTIILKHLASGTTIWVGSDDTISTGGLTVWPLEYGDVLTLSLKAGNNNNLYAIISSGTITLYAAGVTK